MNFRIDRALTAVFAVAFLCALGASAKADTSAGDGKVQPASARHGHRVHAKPQLREYTTISRNAPQTQYREFPWQANGWEGRRCRIGGTHIKAILPIQSTTRAITALVGRR